MVGRDAGHEPLERSEPFTHEGKRGFYNEEM